MVPMNLRYTWSAKEPRLLSLFKEVGRNLKTWGSDGASTYIQKPVEHGNAPKALFGAGALVAGTILEAPDYFWSGVLDYPVNAPPNVPFGRMRRDTGELLKNVVTLRPFRLLVNVSQLAFTDLPMDTIDVIGGFEHTGRLHDMHSSTRSQMQYALAYESN